MDNEERAPHEREAFGRAFGAGLIFLAAFALRYAFVEELRDHSYLGNLRVSDARTYYQLARQIVEGTAPFEPYWQAPLYPLLLSAFQAVFGNNLHTVHWLHIAIGALNCALVFRLSERLFGVTAGWVTGLVAVIYAPFWLFDAQPLPANVTALLDLLAVLAWLRFRESGSVGWLAWTGLLLGAAIVTHGLAIFTLPVFVYDLVRNGGNRERSTRGLVAIFLVVATLAPLAVSVRNSLAAGEPVFISYNAGINLYLGNHRDLEETLGRRGGYEWGELFRDPYTSGAKEPAEMNRFFLRRAVEEWVEAPLALCGSTLQKFLITIGGHEAKRNFPIYPLRDDSSLLRWFLFEAKVAGWTVFAFPAGLLIPLVFLGVVMAFREHDAVPREADDARFPAQVALAHLLGMLIFFPTARYRVPAMFLLLPYAGWMVSILWSRWTGAEAEGGGARERRVGLGLATGVAGLLALAVVNPIAANVFRHPIEDRAAHLYHAALWANEKLRFVKSESLEARLVEQAEAAMQIDPDYPEPVGLLAAHYLYRDIDRSLAYFARLAELVPNDAEIQRQLREALAIRDANR
ncbi:MAG: glycosyltransferase family 39 protein [Myxococcota bacterium]|jgi:4-amino-4-deoxy-L-arabinose transferase-like glycosyltransferase|nr:glycosyltransferase family 39 protein [Myxococcota bacterium]